jgi:hypothetical protein
LLQVAVACWILQLQSVIKRKKEVTETLQMNLLCLGAVGGFSQKGFSVKKSNDFEGALLFFATKYGWFLCQKNTVKHTIH